MRRWLAGGALAAVGIAALVTVAHGLFGNPPAPSESGPTEAAARKEPGPPPSPESAPEPRQLEAAAPAARDDVTVGPQEDAETAPRPGERVHASSRSPSIATRIRRLRGLHAHLVRTHGDDQLTSIERAAYAKAVADFDAKRFTELRSSLDAAENALRAAQQRLEP